MTKSTNTNDTNQVVTQIREGDKVGIMVFLRQGGDPNARNHLGWTILHVACLEGQADIALTLLDGGALVNCCTTDMCTPLHLASTRGSKNTVETLINKGAYINAQDKIGNTPLHEAAKAFHTTVVDFLLQKKADRQKTNKKGQTFIDLVGQQMMPAVECGDTDVLVQWLDWGLNANTVGNLKWSILHHASARGQINIASLLLEREADVNACDSNRSTPLHAASFHGHKRIAQLLIGRGAHVNAQDQRGGTPLHSAIAGGHPDIINLLIESGCDTTIANHEGQIFTHLVNEFLIDAVEKSRVAHVISLLKGRADPNTKDPSGVPILCYAAFKGDVLMVDALLEAGADPNLPTEDNGKRPLHCSSCLGDLFVLKALLDKGASVAKEDKSGCTPLHEAVRQGSEDVVTVLIGRGAPLNAQDSDGNTPLHVAARWGQSAIVELVLEKNANEEIRNKCGMLYSDLALMRAVRTEDANQVISGLAWGGNPNIKDSKGGTLLHHAVYKNAFEVCSILLESEADVNVADQHGRTPLLLAAYRGNCQIVEILLGGGADPNAQDSQGRTPLHWAADEGSVDTVELLLSRGANRNIRSKKGLLFSDLLLKHLYFAVRHNDEAKVECLVRAGADQTAELRGTGITPRDEAKRRKLYPILRKMISMAPSRPLPNSSKEEIIALEDVRKLFEENADDGDSSDESNEDESIEEEEYDPDDDAYWKMHNAAIVLNAKEVFEDEEKSFWDHWEEKPKVIPAKEFFKEEAWWDNCSSTSDQSSSESESESKSDNKGDAIPTFEETKKAWGNVVSAKDFFREDECWWRDAVEDLDKPKAISSKDFFKEDSPPWWERNSSSDEETEPLNKENLFKEQKNDEKSEDDEISVYEDIEESLTDDWETANDSVMSDTSTMYSVSEGDKVILATELFAEKPWWDNDETELTDTEKSDHSSSVEEDLSQDKSDRSVITEITDDSSYTEKEKVIFKRRIFSSAEESEASTNIILEDNADNESIGNILDLDNDEESVESINLTNCDNEVNQTYDDESDDDSKIEQRISTTTAEEFETPIVLEKVEIEPIDQINLELSKVEQSIPTSTAEELETSIVLEKLGIESTDQINLELSKVEQSIPTITPEEFETSFVSEKLGIEPTDQNNLELNKENKNTNESCETLNSELNLIENMESPLSEEVYDNSNSNISIPVKKGIEFSNLFEHDINNKQINSDLHIISGENIEQSEDKVKDKREVKCVNSLVSTIGASSNTFSNNGIEDEVYNLDTACNVDIESSTSSNITQFPNEKETSDNILVHSPSIKFKIKDVKLDNKDSKGKITKCMDEKMITVKKRVINKMDACLARVDASLAWLDARMANDSQNEIDIKKENAEEDSLTSHNKIYTPNELATLNTQEIKHFKDPNDNPESFQIYRIKVRIPEQHTLKPLDSYIEKNTNKLESCLKGSSSENALHEVKGSDNFVFKKNEMGIMQKYNSLAKLESVSSIDKDCLSFSKHCPPTIREEYPSTNKTKITRSVDRSFPTECESNIKHKKSHFHPTNASNYKPNMTAGESRTDGETISPTVRRHSSAEFNAEPYKFPRSCSYDGKFNECDKFIVNINVNTKIEAQILPPTNNSETNISKNDSTLLNNSKTNPKVLTDSPAEKNSYKTKKFASTKQNLIESPITDEERRLPENQNATSLDTHSALIQNEESQMPIVARLEDRISPSGSNWRWSTFESRSLNNYDNLINTSPCNPMSKSLLKKCKSVNSIKDISSHPFTGEGDKHSGENSPSITSQNLDCIFPTNICCADPNPGLKPPLPPRRNKDNRHTGNINEKYDITKTCPPNTDTNATYLSQNLGKKETIELEETVPRSNLTQKEKNSAVGLDQTCVVDLPEQAPKPPPRKALKKTPDDLKQSSSCSVS